jgi:hypothetical protein
MIDGCRGVFEAFPLAGVFFAPFNREGFNDVWSTKDLIHLYRWITFLNLAVTSMQF